MTTAGATGVAMRAATAATDSTGGGLQLPERSNADAPCPAPGSGAHKRKAPDANSGSSEMEMSKRQLLGLTFFTSVLMGLFPLQKLTNCFSRKRRQSSQCAEQPQQSSPVNQGAAAEPAPGDAVGPGKTACGGSDQQRQGQEEPEPCDDDTALDDRPCKRLALDAAPPEPAAAAVDEGLAALHPAPKPAPAPYAAPLAKPVKLVSRAELRRQLHLQLQPADVIAASTPPRQGGRPAQAWRSRGSRLLLNLAAESPRRARTAPVLCAAREQQHRTGGEAPEPTADPGTEEAAQEARAPMPPREDEEPAAATEATDHEPPSQANREAASSEAALTETGAPECLDAAEAAEEVQAGEQGGDDQMMEAVDAQGGRAPADAQEEEEEVEEAGGAELEQAPAADADADAGEEEEAPAASPPAAGANGEGADGAVLAADLTPGPHAPSGMRVVFGGSGSEEDLRRRRVRFSVPLVESGGGGAERAEVEVEQAEHGEAPLQAGGHRQATPVQVAAHAAARSPLLMHSRFGPGAFVRASAGGPGAQRHSLHAVMPDGSTVIAVVPTTPADDVPFTDAPPLAAAAADPHSGGPAADAASVVIARRLRHRQGMARRMNLPPPMSPRGEEAALQDLREAFLNGRLAERWRQGKAWARLDLAGLELHPGADHGARVEELVAELDARRGQVAADAALEQLEGEWEHLSRVRQRYAGPAAPPAAFAAATEAALPTPGTAPRGILKHASAVGSPQESTPPGARNSPPGFDAILAAEIVLGSTWAPLPLDGGAVLQEAAVGAEAELQPEAAGGLPEAEAACAAVDLTPGPAPSRGIKMLASLQQASTPLPAGAAAEARHPGSAASTPRIRLSAHLQQPPPRPTARGFKRTATRGHRLLAALQNAATPTAAAAAASLSLPAALDAPAVDAL